MALRFASDGSDFGWSQAVIEFAPPPEEQPAELAFALSF
jgi:hypothetical protein